MARYEVKQGKALTHIDPTLEPEKWYVHDTNTDKIYGPYDTKEQAEAKRRALMGPRPG